MKKTIGLQALKRARKVQIKADAKRAKKQINAEKGRERQ